MTGHRTPPHDLQAEASLLGAMMLDPGVVTTTADLVRSEDFYKPAHMHIFCAIRSLYAAGQPVDPVTVADKLTLTRQLDVVGGNGALVGIMTSTPATTNATAYAEIITRHASMRRLIGVAGEIADIGYSVPDDVDRALGRAHQLVAELGTPDLTDALASWEPVDLGPAIEGHKSRPEPSVLRREDGGHLFYGGQLNYLHGADGIGKSWVALIAAAQELRAGNHVVWVDWEDPDETTIVGRLGDLVGVDMGAVRERLHYIHPHDEATTAAVAKLVELITTTAATLVVLDSVGEAFSVDGVNEDRDDEVAPWMRRVLRPLAEAGAAVLPIDHTTNANDNPLRPSGSKRKRASVTGHALVVEAVTPFAKGTGGKVRLLSAKDRHGNYRRGDLVATVELVVYPDGGMTYKVWPPFEADGTTSTKDVLAARSAVVAAKTLAEEGVVEAPMGIVEARMTVKVSVSDKRAGIEYAVLKGALNERPGPRNARLISYVRDLDQ